MKLAEMFNTTNKALFSRIDRAAMPPDESIEILIEIARGMAASS